ncbi:FMN-binding protein [Prevotella dentasini]|uniref:FMN-binding protein n=1 Tax=Prevotella dentasini TaxID=589537 RepID=UPI000468C0FF|nr:FMN-binding protein [Prevotella dentasini]
MKKAQQVLMLITCLAVIAAAAVRRDGKILGHKLNDTTATAKAAADTITLLDDGTAVVNTTPLAKDISGFGGPVPLKIYIKDNRITEVRALRNNETPEFFGLAKPLLRSWNGKTPEEAQQLKVDAVSGATYSSRGIIGNLHRGLAYAAHNSGKINAAGKADPGLKTIIGTVVVLLSALVPLFLKSRRYRIAQLVLNVAVLGFWCGEFLSWSLFVNYMSNGISFWNSIVPVVMLVVAFGYPLFGKKNYYCTNVCPCGSLQDLASMANRRHRWQMGSNTVRRLGLFRQSLFAVLLGLMLCGIGSEWMDYEVFSAFVFTSASSVVLVLGAVVLLLSFFVPRPYCRFVCPTGTLFRIAERRK